ncbi:MAG: glycogen-binding domain-containing protein [Gemmatimonadetes bacterium]|nr:glycogen-binding domain-containing protein [Gemmatimonadota bacterium]
MRSDAHMIGLAFLLGLSAAAAPATAQQWAVSAQAGRVRSALDPARAPSSIALGLRYDARDTGLRLSGGVPTESLDALWSSAGAWKRAAVRQRGFVAGIDLAGSGFITRDRRPDPPRQPPPLLPGLFPRPLEPVADRSGHALAGQVVPVVGYDGGRLQAHVRAGVSHYTAKFGDVELDRTVRLADAQLTVAPVPSVAVMPAVRRFWTTGEEAATYAGVSGAIAHRRGTVWASVGSWLHTDYVREPWAAGATLRLHRRVMIEAGARRDTFDPLHMQPEQTAWSMGLTVQVGGPSRPAAPVPAEYVGGRATIHLPVSESASRPSIAGDFNRWSPAPMQRTGDEWTYTVALEPGVYHYAFVDADGTWFVPESVPGRKDDGMGGHVAVLVVTPVK